MEDPEKLLAAITEWAQQDERVTALVQTGSRGRGQRVDRYSDFDLEVITPHWESFLDDPRWVERFGPVLLNVTFEDEEDDDEEDDDEAAEAYGPDNWPPPRLVVYAQGRKVDFTVAGEERITDQISDGLEDLYDRGYQVVFDRTGITRELPEPAGSPSGVDVPDLDTFTEIVEEFWFEATQLPIYLKRGDLWVVKFRDNTMKEDLLRMLEWHNATNPDGPTDSWHIGHHLDEWIPQEYWEKLQNCYGRFGAEDGWRALIATTELFAEAMEVVSTRLGFESRARLATDVRRLIDRYQAE